MHRSYAEQDSVPGFDSLSPADRRKEAETSIRRRAGVIGVTGNKDKVKAYRREANSIRPYLHLTLSQRRECLTALARKLTEFPEVRIFADAISKPDFVPGSLATPYEMAFEQVITRSQTCLSAKGDLADPSRARDSSPQAEESVQREASLRRPNPVALLLTTSSDRG
jgi:hypothetical protein